VNVQHTGGEVRVPSPEGRQRAPQRAGGGQAPMACYRGIGRRSGCLVEGEEGFHRDPCIPDQLPEQSALQLPVIRDGEMPPGGMVVDHMGAGMVVVGKPKLFKGPGGLPTGQDRKMRHYAAASTSTSTRRRDSSGIGSPCWRRTARMP